MPLGDVEGFLPAQQLGDSVGLAAVQEKLWYKSFRAKPLPQGRLVAVLGIAPLITTLHMCMAAWGRESLGRRAALL